MKRVIFLVCLLLCGCADAVHSNYHGADAGDIVYSVGWQVPIGFVLHYKKFGRTSGGGREFGVLAGDGMISVDDGITGRAMDFHDDGDEQVQIQHLQPGEYEIYTYRVITGGFPLGVQDATPIRDFSIPFTVVPGKAVYIGEFKIVPTSRGFGVVVVSDKHERDIPIAQRQDPQLRPVTVSVFDVSKLGNPFLVSGISK